MDSCDVLVVGAGPAGLTLAGGLRAHGVSARVVDHATGPATTSRANILHARGVEVLDRLGALGDLAADAVTALTNTTYAGGRPISKNAVRRRGPAHVKPCVVRVPSRH